MPRFTIGSLATGVALFVLVLGLWTLYQQRMRATAQVRATVSPDGRLVASAVDPATGRPNVNGPSDYDLEDSYAWGGALGASTW